MIHISKRGDISRGKAVFIKAAAILVSLVVCAVIITVTTGENPLSVFETMIAGAFGRMRKRAWTSCVICLWQLSAAIV